MPDDFQSFPSKAYPYAVYYGPRSMRFYADPAAAALAWAEVKALVRETPHPPGQGEPCCGDFVTFLEEEPSEMEEQRASRHANGGRAEEAELA